MELLPQVVGDEGEHGVFGRLDSIHGMIEVALAVLKLELDSGIQ